MHTTLPIDIEVKLLQYKLLHPKDHVRYIYDVNGIPWDVEDLWNQLCVDPDLIMDEGL
jgi:hypothetical protein